MDKKSTEIHGGNSESKWKGRVETTSNTRLGVNKEMLEHTTLWHGTGFTQDASHSKQGGVSGPVGMAELVLC